MTSTQADKPITRFSLGPYEIAAYIALLAVFMAQLMRGNAIGGLIVLGGGLLSIWGRLARGPILFLVLVAGSLLLLQGHGLQVRNTFRPAWLDVEDMLMCVSVLAFVAIHCRLQGIWHHHLAQDPRRRLPKADRRNRSRGHVEPERRTPAHVSPQEVSLLILSLPLWALLAQFLAARLTSRGEEVLRIEPWLMRILLVVWALGLGIFVVFNLLDQWKRRAMSPAAAWICLQDTVWQETRGEQRRIQRWLAWKRLQRKEPS